MFGFENPGLREIDIPLDDAQRLVVDLVFVSQLDQRPPLNLKRLVNQVVEMRGRQPRGIGFGRQLVAIFELREPISIFVPKPLNPAPVMLALFNQRFDISQSRPVGGLAGDSFFVMRLPIVGNSQRANEERECQTLKHQSGKDYAE